MIDNQKLLSERITWCALFLSNFVLISVIFTVPSNPSPNPELVRILFFAGLIVLTMSFVVPKLLKNADPKVTQLISLALNEQASLMAFLMAFLFGDNQISYVLFGLSILGFLLKFPKNSQKSESKLDV